MTRRVLSTSAALLVLLAAVIGQQSTAPVLASAGAAEPSPLPTRLAGTGLFVDGSTTQVAPANRRFAPQYPLWTDGLKKERWIYLPTGAAIDGRDEFDWNFPVGTKLWKQFSAGNRPVETRMLWKVAADRWVFATYEWNAEGTDAVLAPENGRATDVEVGPNRRHGIPSRADCTACHGSVAPRPLGFNALQLSTDRDPNSLHAEPLTPGLLTIETLVKDGRLLNSRADLLSAPPRIRTADPQTRAVLGYLAANCSMCHNGNGEITAAGPVIRYRELVEDADAVARSLAGAQTRWQVPGLPDGESTLVSPGAPERSAIVARMRSRSPSSQMPPLGTSVRDQAAIDAITSWMAERDRWTSAWTAAARHR